MQPIFLYGFCMWFVLVMMAIANGFVRDKLYKQRLGDLRAHMLSSLIFIFLLIVATYFFLHFGKFDATPREHLILGALWLVLTLAFEFLFFHYVTGHSWRELFENYNVRKGRLWIFVLLTTLLAPVVIGSLG